ncbi:MAG: endonuclease/exonuclease/phosphatase family protein [Prolixibacteraceae bacterium]|jgi:endonuclease/exonuclease/phosphatase family metal-dependent hydrolase|nr:endonuclease/exonuclease/phosphatase family protein [Prolixibacteraceae bacterium]
MKKSKVKNLFSKFGFVTNLIFGGLLLLVYASVLIPPDTFWPAAFFGFLFPYLLLINLLFIGFYALLKSRKLLLSLSIILIGYQHLFNFIQPIPHFGTGVGGMKILSFNVHYFAKDLSRKQADHPKLIEYLRSVNADIICLQETRILKSGKLSPEAIRDALPGIKYYHLGHSKANAGPMTLSKFPIVRLGEIRFERSANMVLFSDIVVRPGDTIRVYNCHFQSYKITPEDYSLTDPEKSGTNEQQLKEARLISKKMILAFTFRARQARTVAAHIGNCPYPVIVTGDFNDTPLSYTYHVLDKHLKDAFQEAGFGISNTYTAFLPLFRIDYILHSQRFNTVHYQSDPVGLSDHFPVTAVLEYLW